MCVSVTFVGTWLLLLYSLSSIQWYTLGCKSHSRGLTTNIRLGGLPPKRKAVEAFKALHFETFAAGDSYNDLSMIDVADQRALYCPPERLTAERPELPVARDHSELRCIIEGIL